MFIKISCNGEVTGSELQENINKKNISLCYKSRSSSGSSSSKSSASSGS